MKLLLGQLSSGLILGLSAVIYAISYAALIFSGDLVAYVPYGITITLITAAIGGLYGLFAEEPTFVSGPDSNTSSILAGMMVAIASTPLHGGSPLNRAVLILIMASVFTALAYLLIERFGLARMVRFIPFQVMAGFLASTGWLMSSGALNIIAGTPLSMSGLEALISQPWRPELLAGIVLAALLTWLNKRFNPALVIPAFIAVVTLAVNLVVRKGCPQLPACNPALWFFQPFEHLQWLAPWQLQVDRALLLDLLVLAPSFFAVAFVGTLTVLLSLSSLELSYQRDFKLEPALRLHGRWTLATAVLGGYISLISIGRSTMAKQTGGGRYSGLVIAAVCLAVMLGLGGLIAWIPKVALGALVLYLGAGMLRQWLWDLRGKLSNIDLLQVVSILVCVIAFGYIVGFVAGLLTSCIIFVVNYARMPYIRLDTTLSTLRSSVIRDVANQQYLTAAGGTCRIGRFEGFVFFGVANSIYDWYRAADDKAFSILLLDFSAAKGIDQSAVAVIEKIIRTQAARGQQMALVLSPEIAPAFAAAHPSLNVAANGTANAAANTALHIASTFDAALEWAEDKVLALQYDLMLDGGSTSHSALNFFKYAHDQQLFSTYLSETHLAAGELLFHEGQESNETYFVKQGRLEVVKTGPGGSSIRLAKIVAGSMIGEMALYSGQPRTASVVAVEPAVLGMLTRENWERMKLERSHLAAQFDQHVIVSLANTVSRANAALSLQAR